MLRDGGASDDWGLRARSASSVRPKQDVAAAADANVSEVAIPKAFCVVTAKTGRWLFGDRGPGGTGPERREHRTRNPQQFLFRLKLEPTV